MSINDFSNKIKGKINIDSYTLLCLFIVVLVGLSSFGLGRLSVIDNKSEDIKLENKSDQFVKNEVGKSGEQKIIEDISSREKMYIASKNGKLYYGVTCSGAKRISEKNAIWFADKEEAEKAGYELSSSCK